MGLNLLQAGDCTSISCSLVSVLLEVSDKVFRRRTFPPALRCSESLANAYSKGVAKDSDGLVLGTMLNQKRNKCVEVLGSLAHG